MILDKRAGIRTMWVFAVMGAFVLVIVLSGVWKKFEFFITLASFLGFDSGQPPSGTSIVGINLENDDLRYFTGEKWIKIDEGARTYVLDVYEFNPAEIKNSVKSFYRDTKRKPETFSISVNDWRYWSIGFSNSDFGKATISSHTKKGFQGPLNVERANLGYTDALDFNGYSYASAVGSYFPDFLSLESRSEVLTKVISWRDSILQGNSCEKFLPLNIDVMSPQLAPGPVQGKTYTVRKINEYLFVDLSDPVEFGSNEQYVKDNCFVVDSYSDIDRSSWRNDATLQINFIENDAVFGKGTPSKIWWIPVGTPPSFAWTYQSSKTNWNQVLLIDESLESVASDPNIKVPRKYWLTDYTNFYNGLIELIATKGTKRIAAFNDGEEAYDIRVFVKLDDEEREINLDNILATNTAPFEDTQRGLNNDNVVSDKFAYAILNEYNKHLVSPEETSQVFPEYFFFFDGDFLKLINKNGISQEVVVSSGNLIAGPLNLGSVNSDGLITVDYVSSGISLGQSLAVDFINGKNLFDILYGLDATSPFGFSKLSKEFVPSSILGSGG